MLIKKLVCVGCDGCYIHHKVFLQKEVKIIFLETDVLM